MRWSDRFRITGRKSIFTASLLIGIISGLGAILFNELVHLSEHFLQVSLMGFDPAHPGKGAEYPLLLFLLPILGGLLVGLINHYLCPEAGGAGTDSMIDAFHNKEGRIKSNVPFYKSIATILTLSSGGSAGKEGPTALIGAGVGSLLSKYLKAGARARRTLLLAGTAGGLGAIFGAPFGGAIAAVEILYKNDMESDSLVPCIISSVSAHLVFKGITKKGAVFNALPADVGFTDQYEQLIFYLALAIICYMVGYIFFRVFNQVKTISLRLPVHDIFKPALGGLMVGLVALFYPQAIGSGFPYLNSVLHGDYGVASQAPLQLAFFFLFIGMLRILTTSFTVATRGSGGIFGPSLFVGAMLGGVVAFTVKSFFPGLNISVASFMLVGMGAYFAGIANAPIAGMIMVCDMIGDYTLLPPLMVVSILAVIMSHRWSIYPTQVENRFSSPAHYWDMNLDILEKMTIRKDLIGYRTEAMVSKEMLLSELEERALEVQASDFVVTWPNGAYHGIVSLRRIRLTGELMHIKNLVTLEDASNTSIPAISPDDSLGEALRIVLENEVDKIAIVEDNIALGYIRYNDILKIYNTRVRRA